MTRMKDHSNVAGRYTSITAGVTRAFNNFARYFRDPKGVLRHRAGAERAILFGYLPERPSYALKKADFYLYNFGERWQVVSDAIDATSYLWKQEKSIASGTALACQDEIGGAGKVTTGATSGNYYAYQMAELLALVNPTDPKAIWLEANIKLGDATLSDLFIGLSARVSSPSDLFDNRVNSIGIRKDSGDAYLDFETILGGVKTEHTAEGTLSDDGYKLVGFKYLPSASMVQFYINETFIESISTNIPIVLMALSFGIRAGGAGGKSLSLRKLQLAIER